MIKVLTKEKDRKICELVIKGHADYDDIGKDIVCASVSSIVITTVNAILRFDGEAISYQQEEGYLKLVIFHHNEIIDQLLENMIALLKELEEQYKKNIKII